MCVVVGRGYTDLPHDGPFSKDVTQPQGNQSSAAGCWPWARTWHREAAGSSRQPPFTRASQMEAPKQWPILLRHPQIPGLALHLGSPIKRLSTSENVPFHFFNLACDFFFLRYKIDCILFRTHP